jgi:DNA-binding transcriptional MerR regulator
VLAKMVTSASTQWLKIGKVADRSGISVKTIRYYEDIGLLAPIVKRSESGYRLFSSQILNRLAFIKRAQSLGFSLSEIQEILNVHDITQTICPNIQKFL